ncbi:uncharacterized protein LOC118495096 [Sander lucioperca]|uniref:uncharacterized protein LOC118495096 n=1 Tax=Sander lucioperca TaxID=283035 RepID=UPI001653BD8E|nr:uncharacterized protein LOC118495096 [Sander lucioperca]
MRACSLHFHSGKPSYEMFENHPDWKPSLRLGHSDVKKTDEVRFQRQAKRRTQEQLLLPQHQDQLPSPAQHQEQVPPLEQHQDQTPSPVQHQDYPHQQPPSPAQHQQPPSTEQECALCTSRRDVINCLLEENRKLKEELEEYRMNENFLSGDDNRVKYYTGLLNYVMFQTLLLSLMPYLPQGMLKKLSPFQLVLLTIMRLRLDLPIQHLGRLFRLHRTTASDAFHHTLCDVLTAVSIGVLAKQRMFIGQYAPPVCGIVREKCGRHCGLF